VSQSLPGSKYPCRNDSQRATGCKAQQAVPDTAGKLDGMKASGKRCQYGSA